MNRFLLLTIFLFSNLYSIGQTLPESFFDEMITDDFETLSGLVFDENGQMYLWEKSGVVHIVDTNDTKLQAPLIDISEEVADWHDHGLLGFALDPNFLSNGYFYLWYVVDRHHMLYYGTSQYHPDSSWTFSPSIGRITRYTADAATNFTTVVPNSRKILLGETKETGVPVLGSFHAGGTLLFGEDKTLLLSIGDCATGAGLDTGGIVVEGVYTQMALADGIITPDQDVGLYRCQYLGSHNGKVIRIDPETGDGLPSNPFYDPANPRSPQSRTWALGFRNPFRMTLIEGTGSHSPADGNPGTLIVGDVGWHSFEEINIIHSPGMNFGWPVFEGHFETYMKAYTSPFNRLAPNPDFGTGNCDQPYFRFKDLLAHHHATNINAPHPCNPNQQIPNIIHKFKAEPPHLAYLNEYYENPPEALISIFDNDGYHSVINVEDPNSWVDSDNFDGQCSLGGVFYKDGPFPAEYHGLYFHADFRGWIRAFHFDENQRLTKVEPFLDNSDDIVSLAINPKDGSMYYIGHLTEIHRISYGGNPSPIAIAEADKIFGASPLEIQFDASHSYDLQGEQLTYHWDFGDGNTSTDISPTHTFVTPDNSPTPIDVTLTITDSIGQTAETVLVISVNNTPPSVEITSFENGDLYPGHEITTLPLEANVSDVESDNENLTYTWTTYLHHNTHYHTEPSDNRVNTHTIISPLGCEDDLYYFRVGLSVTDEHGLTTTKENYIYPYCDGDFIEIIDLEAENQEESVLLNWKSILEDSVTHYVVEKGKDIWNYKAIGTVQATQPQNGSNAYQFVDVEPSFGLVYYRIKAYKANRAFAYSNRLPNKFSVNVVDVFPNPSTGIINLYFADNYDNAIMKIYNSQGGLVRQLEFNDVKENQFEQLRLDVASGTYIYVIEAENEVVNGKLVILNR